MMSVPFGPYLLMWHVECWNWLNFTHTQGSVGQRNHAIARLILLSLLVKVRALLLLQIVLAEEMYVGRSVLRSKTPCVKQSSESIVKEPS